MLSTVGQRLLNEMNLEYEDKAHCFKKLIEDPSKYLTWQDVEDCANTPEFYQFELINQGNNKVSIPEYTRAWVYHRQVQDKAFIFNGINNGNSAVITNYGSKNKNTIELMNLFEKLFQVHSAIHVYCGLAGSTSFSIHDDYPVNFIIQVEGKTRWKVFKNRISYLYGTGRMNGKLTEDQLEVDIDVILEPGDALYIPARAFHAAYPSEKRLSMSIPCWQKLSTDHYGHNADRTFYKINHDK